MKTKELKVQVPEGYEIDKENSTFERIRFKPIKKDITYKDVCNEIFASYSYFIDSKGGITKDDPENIKVIENKNTASNSRQLKKLLALNQLLNIAEYYNNLHPKQGNYPYCITFEESCGYSKGIYDLNYPLYGLVALFNQAEDAQAVIDNPNFREILDTIYKD